jgi:peptidoglycan/LPS O-acetylase OafA/YrhL
MAELVMVDRAVVQALNHAAQPQPLRLLVLLVATALAAGPALLLAVLAVQALRRHDPASLAVAVLAGLGGAAALIAAAAATGCLLLSHRWGLAAAGATLLVALGGSPSAPTTPPTWPLPC